MDVLPENCRKLDFGLFFFFFELESAVDQAPGRVCGFRHLRKDREPSEGIEGRFRSKAAAFTPALKRNVSSTLSAPGI